ncbi:MAG: HDOD domain-containing protein [Nitrospinales bacterium]
MTKRALSEIVRGTIKISSLPEVYFRLQKVLNDPQCSFEEIADVISSDVSLSARLMRIVNSSFYNFPTKIDTIKHAISIIGTWQLRDLALSTTIITSFKGGPEKHINMDSFWKHSITCGITARLIGIHNGEPNSERLFLAGLLHDIGRLILLENLPEEANIIMDRFAKEDRLLSELERETLGFDHSDVGAALMEHWNLPKSLTEVIEYHHKPLEAPNHGYEASIIHLADIFAKTMQSGSSGDESAPPLVPAAWEKAKLDETFLPLLWDRVKAQYKVTVETVMIE